MLDNSKHFIGVKTLAEGAYCSVDINIELLATVLFRYSAANFILVHNHPGGTPYPSDADINLTISIYNIMKPFNKILLDHLIIAGNKYLPIMQIINNKRSEI